MPQLLIAEGENGLWQAIVADTGVAYDFAGGLGGQDFYVEAFANNMEAGQQLTLNNILDCFDGLPEDLDAQGLVDILLADTSELLFGEEAASLITASIDQTLWDIVDVVGTALLEAL